MVTVTNESSNSATLTNQAENNVTLANNAVTRAWFFVTLQNGSYLLQQQGDKLRISQSAFTLTNQPSS